MGNGNPARDRASEAFWSARWDKRGSTRGLVDPSKSRLGNSVNLAYHRYFTTVFSGLQTNGMSLLEVGCAGSKWLPYFARQFGFTVSGLDYSELGCRQAEDMLDTAGIAGEVVLADLFEPPADLHGRFDVLVSFGVVEHFDDTAACLYACARLLKPGGRMLTFIPNMRGAVGLLQRLLSPAIYAVHVPLRRAELESAHLRAELEVSSCDYLMFANWGVVSIGERNSFAGAATRRVLSAASKACWSIERLGVALPPNRLTSPYIACSARKPQAASTEADAAADQRPGAG